MRNRPTTAQRVEAWLKAGNTGTAPEICAALGSNLMTTQAVLLDMKARGIVEQIDFRVMCYGKSNGLIRSPIWAIRTMEQCGPLMTVAMRSRTPIELAWAQPAPRPYTEITA